MNMIGRMVEIVCSIVVLLCSLPSAAYSSDEIDSVKKALVRWMCMEYYWMGGMIAQGANVPIEIKFDGDKFDILARGELATEDSIVFMFYWGRIKEGEAAVIMRTGYPIDRKESIPKGSQLEKRKRIFETGQVIKDHVIMPSDCTPRYDPPSPKKELMIRTVVNTVKETLIRFKGSEDETSNQTREVSLVIANFNIDYPYTYVLVEPYGEVYHIALHDFGNYDSDEYEKTGSYPWNTIPNFPEESIKKIREHGVIEKITLKPR